MRTQSDARLYAAAIAVASGVYSVATAAGDRAPMMGMSGSVMLVLGVVVIAHGLLLLTPVAHRLGRMSGPLMVVWAAVMLANQAVSATSESMMMSWDGGMLALALLMLASGTIMSRASEPM